VNTEIHNAFINAVLADSCYVDGLSSGMTDASLKVMLRARLSEKLAEFVGDHFVVVNQYVDPGSSGFSVTVFQDKLSGQRYVSMRGTEADSAGRFIEDAVTDLNAVLYSGLTQSQVIAMVNWTLQAIAPENAPVVQYAQGASSADGVLLDSGLGLGNGALYNAGSVAVDGHSLGGHLATVFTRLFNDRVANTFTYNGLGVGRLFPEAFLQNIGNSISQIGANTWQDAKQTNFYATHGINIATNEYWLSQRGQRVALFNEEGITFPNHLIYKLSDSLALADVMGTLDERLSLSTVNSLFEAGSAQPVSSLERVLDALRKTLLNQTDATQIGDAENSAQSRVDFQAKLAELRAFAETHPNAFQIETLLDKTAAGLAGLAINGDVDALAYRYALRELNPFAVLGADYSSHQVGLSLYDTSTGTGTLTPEWIADRSKLLAAVITAHTNDSASGNTLVINPASSDTILFKDLTRGITLRDGQAALDPKRIIFGSDAAETLSGGNQSDRLYGAAGADILKGNAGADYLEGGTGDDTLRGGKGVDTYRIDKTGGIDTLIDFAGGSGGDGLGSILYNGEPLAGTLTQDPAVRNRYHYVGNEALVIRFIGTPGERGNLVIIDPAGARIILENWTSGELGLTLAESASTLQTTDLTGTGQGDNDYLTEAGHGAGLVNTAANQKIYGLDGADLIRLSFSGAFGYGGSGNDIITNGAGDQELHGDEGNDILIASSGDDVLDGGTGDDALQGGADDDLLDGGDGMDLMDGGSGSDVIQGGAGDDFILGGGNLTVALTTSQGERDYQHFADGQVDMLRRNADGRMILPTLIGVSPTNSQSTQTPTAHVEGDAADAIDGGDGDDMVFAGDGDDVVEGGAGKDYLVGEVGNDFMLGGTEDDILHGDGAQGDLVLPANGDGFIVYVNDPYHGDDYLDGGEGNDLVFGDGGADELFGGAGDDRLYGDSANVAAEYHGDDYLDGEAGQDTLVGGGGADTLFGGADNDQLFGDANDIPLANQGDDYLDGEGGDDYLRGYGGKDSLIGGEGADQLLGEAGDDDLDGGEGDDILVGGADNDILTGGAGTDYLDGGLGDDTYIQKVGDGATAPDGTTEAIADSGGTDTLRFDAGITLAGIATSRANANDLVLEMGADRLVIAQGWGGALERFEFADGTRYSFSQLVGRTLRSPQVQIATTPDATLLGGSESDTLTASGGRARVSGGQGNDVLRVLGADNTILYAKGDGTDHVATAAGSFNGNVLRLSGVTAADLKLGLGSLAIQIGDDANDVIHFEGFDPADVFAHRPFDHIEFDDGSTLSYDALMAKGFDIGGSAGNDLLTGTSVDDRISGGAGDDQLDGGSGSDRLIGGEGNDTYRLTTAADATDEIIEAENQGIDTVESAIDHSLAPHVENLLLTGNAITATGNALDNTLAGNALDNVLTGGEGNDTYRFARQSGNDLLIDNGANRIELESGLAFADLAASRDGDDLLLAIRRDTGSLRVQGYFTDGTPWQVSDAEGNGSTTETLLADTAAYEEDRITTLALDFLADTRLAIEQSLTAQGLARQANGTWARTTQWANNLSVTQTEEFTTTTYTGRFINGVVAWTSTGTSHDVHWTQPGAAYRSQTTASILQSRISAGGAEVHALGGDYQYATQSLWAEVRWGAPQAGGTTSNVSQTLNTPWTVNGLPGWLDATYRYDTVTTHYLGALTGRYLAGPGAGQPPAAVTLQVDSTSQTYRLEEINLTDGDHVVHASAHSAVIGGTGNNTIYDAGFAYGGTGDSTIYNATHAYGGIGNAHLIGGNLLVAGTGDQWLENGATMVVGDGHNTVVGGAGQVVEVGRDNIGRDLVLGQGDQTWNVLDAVYQAQGIYDWQEGYEHGGQYYLSNNEAGPQGYYDTLAALASELQPWASLSDLLAWGEVRRIDFLPVLVEVPGSTLPHSPHYAHTSVPVVTHSAADLAGLQPFYDSGVLASPTLSFGAGIVRGDLQFSWAEAVSPLDGSRHVALDIGWGQDQGIRVLAPRIVDPLGTWINDFVFADGDRASLAELIALAPPAPDFDPDFFQFAAGMGAQSMGANDYPGISFNGGLTATDLTATRDGDDVVLSFGQGGDSLRIVGGRLGGIGIVKFDDATVWTWPGPGIGTPGDDILSDYHALYGQAGNDTLNTGAGGGLLVGGRGDDTYVVNRGDGAVTIDQSMADDPFWAGGGDIDVVRFGAGIAPGDIDMSYSAVLATLTLGLGGDDAIHLQGWRDPDSRQVARYEFADGSVWTADSVPVVLGTNGADWLDGTPGKDTLLGRGGDDFLHGEAGDDILNGGAGEDTLTGGAGSDVYRFARGDGQDVVVQDGALHGDVDVVRFGAGIAPGDVVVSLGNNNGDLVLTLVDSDDSLTLANWFHPPGARVSAVEFADGEAWDKAALLSQLVPTEGTAGDDLLVSTPAHHVLNGGAGDDSYFVTADTPSTHIADEGGTDTLILDDANLADVSLGVGSLKISVNATGQEIHLDDFDPDNPHAAGGIEYFRFADGTFLTKAGLIDALGFHPTGTGGDDVLSGTSLDDVITGLAGNDTLDGRGGSDILDGGSGDDSYLYAQGDGADRIVDEAGVDCIVFGPGILASEVLASLDGGEVVLSLSGADSIRFGANGPGSYAIEHVEFDDGISWQAADLLRQLSRTPPTADLPLADQVAAEDAVFRFAVPAESFADADAAAGDTLAYSARLADGSPLPGWLAFDAATRTFEGMPDNADVGDLAIELVATDGAGNSVSQSFGLTVANTNDAPIAAYAIADQSAAEGYAFSVAIPFDSFADIDVGDSLVYAVTLADGSALPAWLGFDPWTGILSGTPPGGAAGSLSLTVTATDMAGASATGNFTISVTGGNHAPELAVAIADQSATQDLAFFWTVPAGSFIDSDPGDSLSYTATLADGTDLPTWLAFDAATATFSGTPGAGDPGVLALRVTATDNGGLSAQAEFSLAIGQHLRGTGSSDTMDYSASHFVGVTLIDGGLGNDAITGSAGNDVIVGGTGSDNLKGGAGDDIFLVTGSDAGYDRFEGGDGADIVQGGDGDDTIRMHQFTGTATVERIDGNGGYDIIAGTGSSDTLDFSATELTGIALIDGGLGNDAITGSAGNDVIVGGAGSDNLRGGAGDDVFLVTGSDAGYDRFEGGDGADIVQGGSGDDTIRLHQFTGTATVEKIDGGGGYDTIAGTGSSDTLDFSATELTGIALIDGGLGNDAITGSAGNDVVVGGSGSDNLKGGAGDDVFLVSGADTGYDRFDGGDGADIVQGGIGDDTIRLHQFTGTATVEKIDGGGGYDTIAGTGSSDALDFSATELTGIALIDGGLGNDAITGSAGNDVIVGGAGSDNLKGDAGDDVFLVSGADTGYDRFDGGDGVDIVQGGDGDDTIRMHQFTGTATVERIDGNGGYDIIAGTGSSDTLDFSATELTGIALIDGGLGNDAITGSAGNDVVVGGSGSDNLKGGAGDDVFLVSGADTGYDRFDGGDGADIVQGGIGDDTIRLHQFTGTATVEKIDGGGGYDTIAGTGSSDALDFSATELTGIALIDGGLGNDAITGSAGNDLIVGGAGSDRLAGGQGSDIYRIGLGDGAETIVENDATPGAIDAAEFLAGIGREQIWLRHVGNNLEASVIGTADKLVVQNWYLGEEYRVEEFRTADGGRLLDSQVENLVQAMAAFAPPGAGQTTLPPAYQEALAPAIAANWQ
jgi:Ca2+-binding RTX toxin-like protein